MSTPEISIVIPTCNRKASLQRVLAALQQQTVEPSRFEVVVVSDGSTDGTAEWLLDMQKDAALALRVLVQENQGVASARNRGYQAAASDLILFLDDDVVPGQVLLWEHLAFQPRDAIVMGPMLTPEGTQLEPWVLWEQRMLEKQYGDMLAGRWSPTARQFYTGNTSLHRRYLEQAGGFDPAFRRAEDVELAYRLHDLGCRFAFNPRAVGFHYARRSFAAWNAIATAYGRNDVVMTRTKGQGWLLPTIMQEYRLRNWMVRALTWLCLGRPRLIQMSTALLGRMALAGSRLSIEAIPRAAYSGIFNLRHYQGIADALGGRAEFWKELRHV
jgi:glycosyltransferase involved in cell wall biosynthesis